MLAFGGIVFFLTVLAALVAAAWFLVAYLRGAAEAAGDGIDPEDRVEPLEKVD